MSQLEWQGIDFLHMLWSKQPRSNGICAMAYKDEEDLWQEVRTRFNTGGVLELPEGKWSTYFCPNLFTRRRQKDMTLPGRWLYQDLDEVWPDECSIKPTLWWETSPGRFQALWLLTHALVPQELASLNKALNRSCGADPGTWNLTRMLRVPGSWNGKRGCKVSPAYPLASVNPDDISLAA
jgi:RepB DNA-primase N-terminal domain